MPWCQYHWHVARVTREMDNWTRYLGRLGKMSALHWKRYQKFSNMWKRQSFDHGKNPIVIFKDFLILSTFKFKFENIRVHFKQNEEKLTTSNVLFRKYERATSMTGSQHIQKNVIRKLWRAGYIPTDRQTSWGVLHHPCTVPVYKLLCNLYTHTHTSASTGAGRPLFRPRKWHFFAPILRCTLHWLQLRKLWATSACSCQRVSVSVQRYSVQYKGYNLVGVSTVEEGTRRGMTALVYWQLHSSLYTGTVQGWWSTPQLVWRSVGM
jgi:hypothetical protein